MRAKLTAYALCAAPMLFKTTTCTKYDEYILAPTSRVLSPKKIHQVEGLVTEAEVLVSPRDGSSSVLSGNSTVTLDFGINIAGIVSVSVGPNTPPDAIVGFTFSESSLWVNRLASDGTAESGLDAVLWLPVGGGRESYTVADEFQRGGFRYLTVINNQTNQAIEISSVTVNYTAAPNQDLRAYTGYFHSDDELLNRIWYAGAYTNQLCTIDPQHGDSIVNPLDMRDNITLPETNAWYLNWTITNGTSALVDGAKRDRIVWPGDMAVSMPAVMVSTYDMESPRNSLESLIAWQDPDTGRLPYVGYPFSYAGTVSFTYHLHNLIGISQYYHFTGDLGFLKDNWNAFVKGVGWSLGYVDSTGLMNVTSPSDWLRVGMGGHNIEANAILYYTLRRGMELATVLNDTSIYSLWADTASGIKMAANTLLWDSEAGLYRDNETTTLHPQDGNAWALKANLTQSPTQTGQVSRALQARWGEFGAPAPEAGTPLTISPFIGSFELESHALAGNIQATLALMRTQWGFMLNDPRMTNSTFIEGFSADGSLHYAPYKSDARLNHAHGWSTGPTSVLSMYVAGIQLTSAQGATWHIAPMLGDLQSVDAAYSTNLGEFGCSIVMKKEAIQKMTVWAPNGTKGRVVVPQKLSGHLVNRETGTKLPMVDGLINDVEGGTWDLLLKLNHC
ncbi:hypothetical protein JX265_012731 [Neoarthrinium moseri]|uniref:Alpha-L-rhamnosidase six-hairpin glycosidase domain-containing protein n=1 Tax=Neoarthrinium moseri TaxID=1658444 RepID=A0A9P9WA33_9PEZI|nr:hypothetical protein JX265_012731 [Neoarthrinium moseri]